MRELKNLIADANRFKFSDIPETIRDQLLNTLGRPSVDKDGLAFLFGLVSEIRPENMLEIGLATGSSATCHGLAAGSDLQRFDVIDPLQLSAFRNAGFDNVQRAMGANASRLFFHEESSHLKLAELSREGRLYDYIFIDGDHRFDATMVDVFFADKLLKTGGHLVLDDRAWPMVGAVVNFMVENYHHYEVNLSNKRLSVFRKTAEDTREWFDFWRFSVPQSSTFEAKIVEFQQERDAKNRKPASDMAASPGKVPHKLVRSLRALRQRLRILTGL